MTPHRMSADEFLAWDAGETAKREFVRGELIEREGGDEWHNYVVGNVFMALRIHLRGTPCHVFALDLKLRIEAADCLSYPDVLVTCAAVDGHALVLHEALLVVEVLSPSTAALDRGDKFADYRQLPTLCEYLLLDPDKRLYEVRDGKVVRAELYRSGEKARRAAGQQTD